MKYPLHDKIENIELEKGIFDLEGGRAAYFLYHYMCVLQFGVTHPLWPHSSGFLGDMKNHKMKWYLQLTSPKDTTGYLDRVIDDPDTLRRMEKYITAHNKKIRKYFNENPLLKVSKNKLLKHFEFFFEEYYHLMVTAGTLRRIDRAVLKELRKLFKDKKM